MWDMPHKYWGWAKHDNDLSFTEIVDYLTSDGYSSHLNNVQGASATPFPHKSADLQKLYRNLSNTVHGKLDGLPPLSPERYSPNNSADESISLAIKVQKTLIAIWVTRFPILNDYLNRDFPQLTRQ